MKNELLLFLYIFTMSLVLGREYEKKYNPLKVSINAPDNTTADAFDILIYNGNNINMHKAVAKDIVELDALPKEIGRASCRERV